MRTHALAKAARDHGRWTHRHHSRIGYPWDVRGRHKNPENRRTWHDDIAYLHDRGHASARGNLKDYVTSATASIRRAIYLERPSVVHAASAYVNALPALLAARSMGVPFVYEVRGLWEITAAMGRDQWEQTDRFRIEKDIETVLAVEADGVIAITEGVRGELIKRGVDPERIVLSPNGISPNSLPMLSPDAELQRVLGLDPKVPTLGYIGSFVQYEGLELLLEVVQKLKSEGLKFNVLLVGDGPSYQSFLKTVTNLGLQDDIILPGRIPHEEVARHYSVIDVTVFPRLPYEVCQLVSPLKPLEALLLGKLVVGSSVGGIREIIQHDVNGLIFAAGNAEALAAMLRDVILNLDSYSDLRRKGQVWVEENRGWAGNIKAAEALFDRVSADTSSETLPLRIGARQSLSIQANRSGKNKPAILSYTDEHGFALEQSVMPGMGLNDKHIFADVITPAGAAEMIEATGVTAPRGNSDHVVNYFRTGSTRSYFLHETLPLSSQTMDSDLIAVTPGGRYHLKVDLVAAATTRDHAIIGIQFVDCDELDAVEIGMPTLARMPGCVYAYVSMSAGTQTLSFRVPEGVERICAFARHWTAKPKTIVTLKSGLVLEVQDSESTPTVSRFHAPDVAAVEHLGKDELLLGKTPALANMPVVAGRRYKLSLNIAAAPDMRLPTTRSGVITFDFCNSQTGAKVRSTILRYSDTLGAHYNYVAEPGKLEETIRIPEGADRLILGVQCWNAAPGTLKCSDRVLIEELSDREHMLEWNADHKATNILLFADLNVNMVDGSAVWLVSMANALSQIKNSVVHVLLRYPVTESPFADELNRIPNCRLIDPVSHFEGKAYFTSDDMPKVISQIDEDFGGFDHLVIRGFNVNYALTADARLEGRICPYLTDIPQQESELTRELWGRIELIFRRAGTIFLQSSWLIKFVKSLWSGHDRKFVQLPPMLPEVISDRVTRAGGFNIRAALQETTQDTPKIVYAGKMAPEWGILELFDAFDMLRKEMPDLELHILGSKVHDPKNDPGFYPTVRDRLAAGKGLVWRRDLDRQSVLRLLPQFTVGWSWRDPDFENSNLELSTKLLEYGKCGLPVILTETDRYRELLGKTYPFLAPSADLAYRALKLALSDDKARSKAVSQLQRVLAPHELKTVSKTSLAPVLRKRTKPGQVVLLAGHDLKFSGDVQAGLLEHGYQVLVDRWQNHTGHAEAQSLRLLERADKIICEWGLGNLVWYSHNVRPEQRLIVRIHAQELFTQHLDDVNWSAVHKVVFVSEQYRRMGIENFSIPPEKCVLVPNSVNTNWYRPSTREPGKHIGLMGIVPWLKRPDRAFDIVQRVLRKDPDFTFSIKGKMPEDYPWMKNRPEESAQYFDLFRRVVHDPLLKNAVSFDGFGHDVPIWASGLDFILSTSDRESFHLAVAECAAVGVHPVILPWEGAREVYPEKWVVEDEAAAAERILDISRLPLRAQKAMRKANVKATTSDYEAKIVVKRFIDLLK
ncbi:MAG: glycosyltransferase [Roseovarius sp.]|nr:glycosyltransferase [Roseovarius sp.]